MKFPTTRIICSVSVFITCINGSYYVSNFDVEIIPCFKMASSTQTKEQVLQNGTSDTLLTFLPIVTKTLCTVFS